MMFINDLIDQSIEIRFLTATAARRRIRKAKPTSGHLELNRRKTKTAITKKKSTRGHCELDQRRQQSSKRLRVELEIQDKIYDKNRSHVLIILIPSGVLQITLKNAVFQNIKNVIISLEALKKSKWSKSRRQRHRRRTIGFVKTLNATAVLQITSKKMKFMKFLIEPRV